MASPAPIPTPGVTATTEGSQQGAAVFGSVASVSEDTMTVTTRDGGITVDVSSAKTEKTVDGTPADLTAGEMVMVMGQQGSDSSFTATSVEISPAGAADEPSFRGQGAPQGQPLDQGKGQGMAPGQEQGTAQGQNPAMRPLAGSV